MGCFSRQQEEPERGEVIQFLEDGEIHTGTILYNPTGMIGIPVKRDDGMEERITYPQIVERHVERPKKA